ncbi:MAG TPA: GNAT family N-acetyltransferase [Rhizomicrobium sp.]|nr:GNAT family N-acetyltransferase [Rhizomicrobium sp.]
MASASKRRIPMTVTFLEMNAKPTALPPPQPRGKVALLRAEKPPTHFYRYLYDTIGNDYYWVDRRKLGPEALTQLIHDPLNQLFVLYADGNPAGMAELDFRKSGSCNISYFGLMPEAIGRRLGFFFLYHTCINAWLQPIARLTINTCTLDHPRALPLYQRMGFRPYDRQERFVELP